jgi:RimJ/RimL family protein N-acetyltransferase
VISFVYGHNDEVAKWTFETFKIDPWPVVMAVGLLKDQELIGSFLFQEYNGSNAELSYYGKGSLTPRVVREIARAALIALRVNRLTVRTKRCNKHITKPIRKLGFRYEGVQRMFYGPFRRDDAVLFGLLKPDLVRIARLPS